MIRNMRIVFWILFATFILVAGCEAKERSEIAETQQPSQLNCEFAALRELVGKSEKEISHCFEKGGAALIGKENKFATKVFRRNGQFILILSRKKKDAGFIVTDAILLPKIAPNDTILYGSCYSNYKSGVVDAVAIAKYVKNQQFLAPKQSWIIDFEAGKIKPNEGTKLTCVNESYGV